MKASSQPFSELIAAAALYRRTIRGRSGEFTLGLLLLFKKFYDQKAVVPGLKTPKAFLSAFDELEEMRTLSPEIALFKLCKLVDELDILQMSFAQKLIELERTHDLDYAALGRFLVALCASDLSLKSLKDSDESFESLFYLITSGRSRSLLAQRSGQLERNEIRPNVIRTMVHFLRVSKGHQTYCPYDYSISFTPHLGIRLGEDGYLDLNKDLNITVQAKNSHQLGMHQLALLANDIAGVEFHNSDPLTQPLLKESTVKFTILDEKATSATRLEGAKRLRRFDRVIAFPPVGLRTTKELIQQDPYKRFGYGGSKLKIADFLCIQQIISSLNDDGIAVVLTSKGPLLRDQEVELRKAILAEDIIEAIIQLPSNSCGDTSIPLIMLVFNKAKHESHQGKIAYIDAQRLLADSPAIMSVKVLRLFEAYEDNEQVCRIVDHAEVAANDYNLAPQFYIDDSDDANRLRGLMSQHSNYKMATLNEVVSLSENGEVLKLKKLRREDDIDDSGNCIYMPSISNMQPLTDIRHRLANTKTPIDRYYQVHLNPDLVLAEFAEFFFKTELGQSIFRNLGEGVTVPHVNRAALLKCKIATPPTQVQREILDTFRKFERLETLVDDYKRDVVLNPESAVTMSNKLDDMIASVAKLTEEELVLGLIRGGENRHVEFKETFEFNKHINGNRDNRLIDACIKTIAAFLNSGGGDLLVGVSDNQQVIGIERDIKMNKGSHDSFLLHFKNFIEKRIGQEYYTVIDQKIVTVRGKPILRVNCGSARDAKLGVVFVDNEDCYIRTNPATDRLTGRELEKFLRNFVTN